MSNTSLYNYFKYNTTNDESFYSLFDKLTKPISSNLRKSIRYNNQGIVTLNFDSLLEMVNVLNGIVSNEIKVNTNNDDLTAKIAHIEDMVRRVDFNNCYKPQLQMLLDEIKRQTNHNVICKLLKKFFNVYKEYQLQENNIDALLEQITALESSNLNNIELINNTDESNKNTTKITGVETDTSLTSETNVVKTAISTPPPQPPQPPPLPPSSFLVSPPPTISNIEKSTSQQLVPSMPSLPPPPPPPPPPPILSPPPSLLSQSNLKNDNLPSSKQQSPQPLSPAIDFAAELKSALKNKNKYLKPRTDKTLSMKEPKSRSLLQALNDNIIFEQEKRDMLTNRRSVQALSSESEHNNDLDWLETEEIVSSSIKRYRDLKQLASSMIISENNLEIVDTRNQIEKLFSYPQITTDQGKELVAMLDKYERLLNEYNQL